MILASVWFAQGCSPGVQTDAFATLSPAYQPALVWHASHKSGLRTVAVGTPFADGPNDVGQKLQPMLHLPPWHQRAVFTMLPRTTQPRGYRVVLVFNPVAPLSFGEACADLRDIETARQPSALRLHGAFCSGKRPLSEINGRGHNLQAVLDQTLAGLLPPANRVIRDEHECPGVFRLCL